MNKFLNRISNLLLLVLCILSIIYLIAQSFGCSIDESMPVWIVLLCITAWISASFRRGLFLGLPLSAALLYLAYDMYASDLSTELSDLIDRLAGAYFEHFYAVGSSYIYSNSVDSHTTVFIFLAFLLASYMAVALTAKSGRVSMAFIGTLPLFAASIAVNGKPEPLHILGIMLFWFLLYVGGGYYDESSGRGKAVFAAALPVTLGLWAIMLIRPPQDYSYSQEDVAISQRFRTITNSLGDWVGSRSGDLSILPEDSAALGTDSPQQSMPPEYFNPGWRITGESIELSNSFDQQLGEQLVFRARSNASGNIYLRSMSYGEYTGTGWLAAEDPGISSLDFTAAAAGVSAESSQQELQLRFVADSDYMLLPYYSSSPTATDSYVPNAQNSYSLDYSSYPGDFSALSLPDEYIQAELEYRSFAHDYYTRLPDSTRQGLLDIAQQAGLSPDSSDIIGQVASFIQSSGRYDLSTAPYPSQDYALYFLQEARQGYCVHFASAATAMYRALGIPARLTEGFLFTSVARQYTDVRGENAHAWVEVYIDYLGWVPVEVTGSSAGMQPDVGAEPEYSSPAPLETAPVESSPADSQPPQPTQSPEAIPVGIIGGITDSQTDTGRSFPWKYLLSGLAALLLIFALPLWRLVRLSARRRAISHSDGRKAAVALWRWAQSASVYGIYVPKEILDCAEKAAFSPHQVTKEELSACRRLLTQMLQEGYASLKPLKKFSFKFIHGLI